MSSRQGYHSYSADEALKKQGLEHLKSISETAKTALMKSALEEVRGCGQADNFFDVVRFCQRFASGELPGTDLGLNKSYLRGDISYQIGD